MGGGASTNFSKVSAGQLFKGAVQRTTNQKEKYESDTGGKQRKPDIVSQAGLPVDNIVHAGSKSRNSLTAGETELGCEHGKSISTSSESQLRQTAEGGTSSTPSKASSGNVSIDKVGARALCSVDLRAETDALKGSPSNRPTRTIIPPGAVAVTPSVRPADTHSKYLPFTSPVRFVGRNSSNEKLLFASSEPPSASAAIEVAAQIAASKHFTAINDPASNSSRPHMPGSIFPPQRIGGGLISTAPPKPKGPTSTPQKSRSPSFTVPLPSTPQRSRSPSFTLIARSRSPSFSAPQRDRSPSLNSNSDSPRRMRPPGPGYIRPPDTNHTVRSFHYNGSRPSSVFTGPGAPSVRGVAAGPHPPGQFSTTGCHNRPKSSNHNNLDPNRRLPSRPFPSNALDKERNVFSYDDDEQYSAVFTDPAMAEPMSAKPSVIPPLHLNSNLNGNMSLSFPTGHQNTPTARQQSPAPMRGVGTASPGLRVNTNTSQINLMASVASGLMARSSGPHSAMSSARGMSNGMNTPNGMGTTRSMAPPNSATAYEVKETNDVKRNRAKLPPTMIHAKPTTGDWLKKRYIVNNYILLDTLGTGSYGEVSLVVQNKFFASLCRMNNLSWTLNRPAIIPFYVVRQIIFEISVFLSLSDLLLTTTR